MMNFFRSTLFLFVLLLGMQDLMAQQTTPRVYQLSGLVIAEGSQEPVPFARVRIKGTRRGSFANVEGFYSIPVFATDTIYISSIGYRRGKLIVADYLKEYHGNPESPYLYAINYLKEDSIVLPDIAIFPYNNATELRTALINTNVDEAIESINARENLNPDVMDILIETLDIDEGERVMIARQLYYNEQQQRGVAPTATLFDPMAIYQLLNYIHRKTKEKKNRNFDYWPE